MLEFSIFGILLMVLIFVGIPIAWSLLISGSVGLIYVLGVQRSLAIFTNTPQGTTSSYLYTTIPMFILMAFFLSKSRITEDVFKAINMWTGNIRGGLAMATTVANGGMAALSGSSTAAAATMAQIGVPEMRKYGYDDRLSMGTVSSSGTFAVMIPPSLGLILYGILTNTGIAALFIGGVIPGILTIGSYLLVIHLWVRINPDVAGETSRSYSLDERVRALGPLYPAIILLVIVLGGLYGGVMTPTEAGAIGAAGALVVSTVFSNLRLGGINEALGDTLRVSTMIFMIMIGAMLFSRFLTVSKVAPALVNFVGGLPLPEILILLAILLVYVVLGMFMNQSAILILTLPLTYPMAVNGLGFDPIWFGVVLVKVSEIGMVTPPLGLNVYVASATVDVDVETTFAGAFRFIVADVAVLLLMLLIPEIILWLPGTMQ